MGNIAIEVVAIFLMVFVNGLLAMSELAVVSARKPRLRQQAMAGDARSLVALGLAEDPNRLLSTVQIGITFIGTLAGVFGGATIAEELADRVATVPALAPFSEEVGFAVVVVGIAYVTLVLGELVPKRLALGHPEGIARLVARPLRLLSWVVGPFVRVLGWSTDLVLHLLLFQERPPTQVTEEDIRGLLKEGAEAGVVDVVERDIVHRVFRMNDVPVRVFMTKRSEVVWIDADGTVEEARRKVIESPHSRFPVCEGSLDKVLGIVQAKDLLAQGLEGARGLDVRGLVRLPLFVFQGSDTLRVLERFKATGMSMAIVLDEYGSLQGVSTLNDILQALIGDIAAAGGGGTRVVRRDDGSWLVDGSLLLDELSELVPLPPFPVGDYETLAGFVLHRLGRIPAEADSFEWSGFTFEVVDMDDNRVDRVLVTRRTEVV